MTMTSAQKKETAFEPEALEGYNEIISDEA